MMTLDSGMVSPRASSRSTGNFPIGQSLRSAVRSPSSIRLTMFGVNAVPFSYSAISALWQNEESGWKCSVRDMEHLAYVGLDRGRWWRGAYCRFSCHDTPKQSLSQVNLRLKP